MPSPSDFVANIYLRTNYFVYEKMYSVRFIYFSDKTNINYITKYLFFYFIAKFRIISISNIAIKIAIKKKGNKGDYVKMKKTKNE